MEQQNDSQRVKQNNSGILQLDESQTAESEQILAEDVVNAIEPHHIEEFVNNFAAYRKAESMLLLLGECGEKNIHITNCAINV
jgi:hypothetical protein